MKSFTKGISLGVAAATVTVGAFNMVQDYRESQEILRRYQREQQLSHYGWYSETSKDFENTKLVIENKKVADSGSAVVLLANGDGFCIRYGIDPDNPSMVDTTHMIAAIACEISTQG